MLDTYTFRIVNRCIKSDFYNAWVNLIDFHNESTPESLLLAPVVSLNAWHFYFPDDGKPKFTL
jgi:hypothetical protein